jgi:hypothetical protein
VAVPGRVLGAVGTVLDAGDFELGVDQEIEPQPIGAQIQTVDKIVALLMEHAYF